LSSRACWPKPACNAPRAAAAPKTCKLHAGLGVLVGIDIGATSLDVAVLRPDLTVLAQHEEPADVREGPGVVLARVRT
jgi:hypothetical protein